MVLQVQVQGSLLVEGPRRYRSPSCVCVFSSSAGRRCCTPFLSDSRTVDQSEARVSSRSARPRHTEREREARTGSDVTSLINIDHRQSDKAQNTVTVTTSPRSAAFLLADQSQATSDLHLEDTASVHTVSPPDL